jgi:hypothetical protein
MFFELMLFRNHLFGVIFSPKSKLQSELMKKSPPLLLCLLSQKSTVAFLGHLDEILPIEETIFSAWNGATWTRMSKFVRAQQILKLCYGERPTMRSVYKNLKLILKSAKEGFDDNSLLCNAVIIFLFIACENALLRDPDWRMESDVRKSGVSDVSLICEKVNWLPRMNRNQSFRSLDGLAK